MSTCDSGELDLLLSDVKRLLDDQATDGTEGAVPDSRTGVNHRSAVSDETRMYTTVHKSRQDETQLPWEAPDFTGAYNGPDSAAPVIRSAAVHVPGTSAGVERQERRPVSGEAVERPAQQKAAKTSETVERRHSRRADTAAVRASAQAHRSARQILEDEEAEEEMEDLPPKKKSHKLRNLLLVLLLLAALIFAGCKLLARQPRLEDAAMGARKDGVSTVLLIGTDAGGARADTLMLLNLDAREHTANLLSIPRDTLVNGSYSVPKINGVYGVNGGGEEGMEMLLQRVSECIGFYPDGYVMVDLGSFVELVDLMGGVTFNVPVDMYYNDPSQDLYIDLRAGEQTLNGQQAMGLVRFRSGYAQADLERVSVQREFVSAAADQWMSPKLILKAPQLLSWFKNHVESDMSVSNMLWIGMTLMGVKTENVNMETLAGNAANILGGSYYILSPYDVAEQVNRCVNPYEREITVDDLYIRN